MAEFVDPFEVRARRLHKERTDILADRLRKAKQLMKALGGCVTVVPGSVAEEYVVELEVSVHHINRIRFTSYVVRVQVRPQVVEIDDDVVERQHTNR